MERSRLKHAILFLLVVLNLFLLALVLAQNRQSSHYESTTRESVLAYLEKNDLSVKQETVPWESTLTAQSVRWDQERDRSEASALLGENRESGEASQIRCENAQGAFAANRNGKFSLTLSQPEGESGEVKEAALELMKKLDFNGEVTDVRQEGTLTTVTLEQRWNGVPLFSCTARVTFQNGTLTGGQGTRLPGTPAPDLGVSVRSPESLLVDFLRGRTKLGADCREIRGITQGYLLEADGLVGRLLPAWRIETDDGTFLLNCTTGDLTALAQNGA